MTAEQLRDRYDLALATLSPEQAWAVDLRSQAETLGAFTAATIDVRLERLFQAQARRFAAGASDPA